MPNPDARPAEPAAGTAAPAPRPARRRRGSRPGPMPDWAGPVVLDAPPWLLRELRTRLDTARTGT